MASKNARIQTERHLFLEMLGVGIPDRIRKVILFSHRNCPYCTARAKKSCTRSYKSSGVSPVRRAIRASILGPISSLSWNAKTMSGHPVRLKTLCEPPDCRLTDQPIRSNAASTCFDLVEGQLLTKIPRRPL